METYKGDAYCVKCKKMVDIEGVVKISDSGRRMATAVCPYCLVKVARILGKAQDTDTKEIEVAKEKEPYAVIEVTYDGSKYRASVEDYRRDRWSNYQTFSSFKRKKAVARAQEWIDAYEVIKLYKED